MGLKKITFEKWDKWEVNKGVAPRILSPPTRETGIIDSSF
jgi:hypothetical protein